MEKEPLLIKIYKEDKSAVIPTIAYDRTSACFDITAIEDKEVPVDGSCMIECGLRIIIPKGYYMTFDTRSSYGIKRDIIVYRGVLDAGYTGNLAIKLFNLSKKSYAIHKGDRCAQASLHKMTPVKITEIDEREFLNIEDESVRGNKGWGSTGK